MLRGKMHLFDHRGTHRKSVDFTSAISGCRPRRCLPHYGLSAYVCEILVQSNLLKPVLDHWQDVLTGSALGLATAYFAYRQYYPPLDYELSERPFQPRLERGGSPLEGGVEGGGPILPTSARADGQSSSSTASRGLSPLPIARYTDDPSEGSLRGRARAVAGADGESARNSAGDEELVQSPPPALGHGVVCRGTLTITTLIISVNDKTYAFMLLCCGWLWGMTGR